MSRTSVMLAAATAALVGAVACSSLTRSQPIFEMEDYEAMTAGRLDADYVGTKQCLSACHYHDELARNFDASTMGAAMDAAAGMAAVDCESCHGPGSLAIAALTQDKVRQDTARGVQTACNYDTFISIKELPAPAQALICLKCHTGQSSFNLHDWASGGHAAADLSCISCHNVHRGPDLITPYDERSDLCLSCHDRVFAELSLPSRHPVRESKVSCTDCHDPHGAAEMLLTSDDERETCGRCHAEVIGPFANAHADAVDRCSLCHNAHGSVNDNLLTVSEPYLCMRCHTAHPVTAGGGPSTAESKGTFFTRCSDCHSAVHGSNIPGPSGRGTFLR